MKTKKLILVVGFSLCAFAVTSDAGDVRSGTHSCESAIEAANDRIRQYELKILNLECTNDCYESLPAAYDSKAVVALSACFTQCREQDAARRSAD